MYIDYANCGNGAVCYPTCELLGRRGEGGEYKHKNSWLPFKSHQIGSRLNWLSILQYLIMKSPFTGYANVNDTKGCRILQLRLYSVQTVGYCTVHIAVKTVQCTDCRVLYCTYCS